MKINGKSLGGQPLALPRQIIRVMKLTMLLMSVCLLQVSAATKAQVYLTSKGEPLQKVLKLLSKQSGYNFVYTTNDLKDLKTGSINLKNASIEAALKACFEGQPLVYKIADKTVMIKKESKSLIDKLTDFFQAIDVTGKVTDEQGQPLPGASVKVKGGSQTTTTDKNGEFRLRQIDPAAILVISFVGFQPMELKASEVKGTITMRPLDNALKEVTVSTGFRVY